MAKFTDIDPHTRGKLLRIVLAERPPQLAKAIRQFRRSPSLQSWIEVRQLSAGSHHFRSVWTAVELVLGRRLNHRQKPTKLEFDTWLYIYYY